MFGAIWRLIKRVFKIGEAEAHAAIDNIENPIRMTEQGIRDLKEDLDKSLQSYAEVKAIAIRTRREAEENSKLSADYESKARALLIKAQSGEVPLDDAKRLAGEALAKKEEILKLAKQASENAVKYDAMTANLQTKIQELKSQVSSWENELRSLKARNTVSSATEKINKQLADVDSSSTLAMLEKMREKVETQEARAEAYGEMANASKSVDDEINKALNTSKGSAALDDLMAQMGMAPVTPPAKVLDIEIQQPVVLENEPKVDNVNTNTNTNNI